MDLSQVNLQATPRPIIICLNVKDVHSYGKKNNNKKNSDHSIRAREATVTSKERVCVFVLPDW